ncbi:MAG TPA: hypothetical protein ACHBX0_12110 [Arsenophonus sp.]
MLDSGKFDNDLKSGCILVGAISKGWEHNHCSPTIEQRLSMWRWMVAACFIIEQTKKNGTVEVQNEEGDVDITALYANNTLSMIIYPSAERFALANHVESIVIENYGREQGLEMTIRMYNGFITTTPEDETILSDFGRESLTTLHNDYLKILQDENIPFPVMVH